jgi:hypothetical protein
MTNEEIEQFSKKMADKNISMEEKVFLLNQLNLAMQKIQANIDALNNNLKRIISAKLN